MRNPTRTRLLSLCFALATLSQPIFVHAANTTGSPWDELDALFGAQELCEAYSEGEHHLFERKSCLFNCSSWNYKLEIHCGTTANETTAQFIYTKVSDGKNFSTGKITESAWQQANRNPLRLKAASVESFGQKFILESLSPSTEAGEADVIVARYSIKSQRPSGELKTVGEGAWWIKTTPGTISQKIIRKEHTTYAIGKEVNTDTLIE